MNLKRIHSFLNLRINMCGIYGVTSNKYSSAQIRMKLERTKFRGPDKLDFKYLGQKEDIVFGHNRLAVIDLDERSNQPFSYQDKLTIVFNGEIYNFKSLKDTLTSQGYSFKTTSDTEVICALYLEHGEKCVEKLNGMFAFVIYDECKNKLFGARDRLGKKPFYYFFDGESFEFASQLSSIQLHHSNLSISSKSIDYYLAWGAVPDPYSIFNEIKKLKAGHAFSLNLENNIFSDYCYWDIDYKGNKPYLGTYNNAKNELDSILKNAVSTRLFADVPVGVFLSGGVDSSLVAAIASKSTSSQVKTFSVKFDEKGFDESKYAQQVADHLKTDHNVIHCNYAEGIDLIQNFDYYYDEPFADSSAIPSMLLAKYTSQKVTVALSGDGGDESFIGYERYKWLKKVEDKHIYDLPKFVRLFLAKSLKLMPYYKLKLIGKGIEYDSIEDLYVASVTGLSLSYLKNENLHKIDELKYLYHKNKNLYERLSDFDIKTYLNWDINTKVDRATMAYSLEARAPLMDHNIVEFARSLPTEFKFKGRVQKRILKDVLYDYVPKEIFNRPKAGFTMPFTNWFRYELKDMVLSELNDEGLRNIPNINVEEVKKQIKQHMDGSWNRYPLIWKLLVLKQWLSHNNQYSVK